MATVGILTFSDGRAFVAEQVEEMNRGFQERLKRPLEADGQQVVTGEEIVWTNEGAVREARRLAAAGWSGEERGADEADDTGVAARLRTLRVRGR
jgi:L-fucose isomerase